MQAVPPGTVRSVDQERRVVLAEFASLQAGVDLGGVLSDLRGPLRLESTGGGFVVVGFFLGNLVTHV